MLFIQRWRPTDDAKRRGACGGDAVFAIVTARDHDHRQTDLSERVTVPITHDNNECPRGQLLLVPVETILEKAVGQPKTEKGGAQVSKQSANKAESGGLCRQRRKTRLGARQLNTDSRHAFSAE